MIPVRKTPYFFLQRGQALNLVARVIMEGRG